MEFSGTMNGPIVCKLCVGGKTEKDRNISLKINFMVFSHFNIFSCAVGLLCLESLWS